MPRTLALCLALVSIAGAGPAAEICVDYGDFLRLIGNAPTEGSARAVVLRGDLAYLADGDAGFTILDLSNPRDPVPVASLDTVGIALWLVLHDDHAFIVNNTGELHVVDVAFPDRPRHVAELALPGNGHALLLRPPHLLMATGHAGLLILDVGDPEHPFVIGVADTPGVARGVDAVGDLAAVADETGLVMIDIANPQQPLVLGGTDVIGQAYGVDLDGSTALVTSWDAGLEVFDVTDPAAPTAVTLLPLPGPARHIQRVDDLAFIACDGLCVVDVSLPYQPRVVGNLGTSDGPISVTVAGDLALVPTADGGLDVIDADPPGSPPVLSVTSVPGVAFGVDAHGSLTAIGAENLSLFDHSDPAAPVLLGTFDFGGSTSRLVIADDLVLITPAGAGGGRLVIVDIRDPAAPVEAAILELDGFVSQMTVRGSLCYLADFFQGGLFVVDIGDPTRPDLEATVPSRPFALQLAQVGDHLLVGTGAFGDAVVQVFDLSDPLLPVLADEIMLPGEAVNGLAVGSDKVIVALDQGSAGELLVFDASDPAAMQQIGSLPIPGEPHEVVVDGSVAYVTTFVGFVHVVDVTDPTAPTMIGGTYLPDSAFVLALSDHAVHAAATDVGLALLPRHCDTVLAVPDDPAADPAPPALVARPNPFNPAVTLSFELARGGPVTITIYDVAGRRVAEVFRGELGAARHQVTWNGRGQDGRAAPSGVYLARLVGDGFARTARLALAR